MFMKEGWDNMVDAKLFKDSMLSLLDHLYESQNEALDQMAQIVADCIQNNGVVHVFGTGHSVGLGIDIKDRIAGQFPDLYFKLKSLYSKMV